MAEHIPVYSVIVPAYQAAGSLELCLDALSAQTVARELYEVIVVDDGSTDGTGEIARRAGAQVIAQRNAGAAAARNAGAAVARGNLLLFTDADCAPVPGWIAALVAPFADERVAGSKGTYLSRQRQIISRFTQLEYEDRYDRMAGAETIDFVDTYSAAYRRDIFRANAGFDPAFLFDEDQEFSFRLTEKGYRLVFAPAAQVYHRHNATLAAYIRRKFLMGHWKVLVTRRHPGRAVKDSHTPQALKLQMGLAAAGNWRLRRHHPGELDRLGAVDAGAGNWLAYRLGFRAERDTFSGEGMAPGPWRDSACGRPVVGARVRLGGRICPGFGPLSGSLCRKPVADCGLAVGRQASHGCGVRQPDPGRYGAAYGVYRPSGEARFAWPDLLPSDAVGQDGRPFRIFKFRTMVDHAEEMLPQLVNLEALPQPAFKLRSDPRVTRIGRLLRRWSLDEVPQLFNVLAGEMSLVGPRPEQVEVVVRYTDDQRRRLAVKPGMTGPMQVNGRGNLPFEERLALELEYIERYALRRDVALLLRTLPAVLRGDGAY